jgi:8-oxo-dGTP diphosphatase
MVTVDAIVFAFAGDKAKLLLIKRGNEPFKNQWALPGGFIGIDEELEDAVARELKEETGLENVQLKQMRTFGKCGRDPRGRQITIAFMGVVEGHPGRIKGGDDAADAKWFGIDALPQNMAFDHNEVASVAIKKLKRNRLYQRKLKGR